MTSGVAVCLLGNVGARRASGPVSIPGLKLQALLALLALAAPGPVSDGRLIDELWGDEPLANPSNSLQAQIAILRRALGRDTVPRVGQGYALAVDADDVDSSRLVQLVDRARQLAREGDQRSAAQSFHTAIELVQGPPLRELADFAFARDAASRLDEVILAAYEGLTDAELAAGRHAEQIVPLTELVRLHPLRERFHAQLMLALYRSGRQADALRAYGSARATLVDELGLEPGPELRELERAVLVHDPRIASPVEAIDPPRAASPDQATAPDAPRVTRADAAFVGRTAEFGRLRADLDDTVAGRGRVALLAGEPGIGKTRLAEELAADASDRGAVVRGAGAMAAAAPPRSGHGSRSSRASSRSSRRTTSCRRWVAAQPTSASSSPRSTTSCPSSTPPLLRGPSSSGSGSATPSPGRSGASQHDGRW